ncbi:MAG TPA: EAL domain-containing protein [Burkholderiales bacterium]|nr:EAL domain-containing protein [Burkholderiales bacterium]
MPVTTDTAAAQEPAADSLEARIQTSERFAEALAQDQFMLFAQPIAPLREDRKGRRHLEIFVRFREEEEHLLPPGTFFPILEANGLTPQLDRWEVGKVLQWAADKRQKKIDWRVPTFAINLAEDTLEDEDFAAHVFASLTESHIPPDRLWFEITVTQFTGMREAAARTIADLSGLGCAVALSDFAGGEAEAKDCAGSGVKLVKLAGGLLRDIETNPKVMSALVATNTACHKVGLQTIAQFVETTETLTLVRRAGLDYAQGFRVAMPVPLSLLS